MADLTQRENQQVKQTCVLWVLLVAIVGFSTGCHRQYYRRQADCEAHRLIDQKAMVVARPPSTGIRIDVDRQSRMFNPFDLDFQPMPPDDGASNRYMQCVDGRRGYPMWEAAGKTNTVESPDWWQFLPLNENGVLVLDLDEAVEIALLHSPQYQNQIENLYLTALGVSTQRFEFDTQFFGGGQTSLTTIGRRAAGAGGDSSTVFQVGTDSRIAPGGLSMRRRFATGSDLVVGVANSMVWELSGPDTQSATTLIDFTLLQPLLRLAGRDVVLESLTSAERDLLAAVRSFERFRRSFFLNVTVGRGLESTITAVDGNNSASTVANLNGFDTRGGYLGLLQDQLEIRNSKENIARQTENLLILEDTLLESLTNIPDDPGSIIRERLQVAQARQFLFTSQSGLVNQQAAYERSVDAFMRTLGLPPYVCLSLNDPILSRFELIARELLSRRQQLSALRVSVGDLNVSLLAGNEITIDEQTGLPISQIDWTDDVAETIRQIREAIEPLADFNQTIIDEDLPMVVDDIKAFEEALPDRVERAKDLREAYQEEREGICGLLNASEIDESIFDVDDLEELDQELRIAYEKLEERFLGYENRINALGKVLKSLDSGESEKLDGKKLSKKLRNDVIIATQDLLADMGDDVLALQLIQARARTESLLLPDVKMDPRSAFAIASRNRRDYANQKAAVVDAWRNIEVIADDLESSLDVLVSGGVGNVGSNPLRLRSDTGRLSVGLRWDAPITRLEERNAYRQALIEYEQTKRSFYQFEDSLWQLLRGELRQLYANRLNFELGRQAIRIAASQIELNADIRRQNDDRGVGLGPTAARDAISALNDLLNAQNNLLGFFVSYEVVRRSLDFDLGTMEISPDGLWIDPGPITPEELLALPGTDSL
ncbi:hypothetical protein LF1_12730 [Rubripirellula obstinata]|uniref:Outer membrane efflux protein n=1 Tax=Rubripirellula obstinata TaxID=406547 RepID=A0A5B1CGP3_9BACT|nr:hypothetical protein [Rubripirellula obstinata]KAA1258750.1 hypothetical protein LF1_12730 [Rubripirellula obstinata]